MSDSFVFYRSFAEALKELPAEEYKEIMTAIADYALDGVMPENLSPTCKCAFILCKPQIDANLAKREAGKRGGEAKQTAANESKAGAEAKQIEAEPKQSEAPCKQNEAEPKQSEADGKHSEANVNVNANANVKEKPSKEGKKKNAELFGLDDPALLAAVKDYERHRQKIKAPLTERALDLALKKLEEMAPGNTAEKIKIINQSILNGWKGLFPLKDEPVKAKGMTRDEDLDGKLLAGIQNRGHEAPPTDNEDWSAYFG